MVLESLAFFWSGGPSKIPSVCYRDKQSSFTGIWCLGGDEWIPKVPDSSRRSVHGQVALCAHMVSFFSVPFSVTVYFRRRYCSMLPLVAANDKNSVEFIIQKHKCCILPVGWLYFSVLYGTLYTHCTVSFSLQYRCLVRKGKILWRFRDCSLRQHVVRIDGSIGEGRVNTYSCPLPSPLLRPVFHLPLPSSPKGKKIPY